MIFLAAGVYGYEHRYEENLSYGLIPIDAVLVLDVSRSMQTADPQRISRDAMNLFIEKLAEGRDRVGVVAYAGQVERSRAVTTIRGQDDRDSFRDFINELEYASWTDHGLGLMEAVRLMYDSHSEGRQPIIIFFTDGNLNVNPSSARSNTIAQQDVEFAISIAQEQGYPIYTIGLNFDGNLDIYYINNISEETGGLVFNTNNAEDLPEIIRAIFASMTSAPTVEIMEEIFEELEAFEEIKEIAEEVFETYIYEAYVYEVYDEEEEEKIIILPAITDTTNPWFYGGVGMVIFILAAVIFFRPAKKRVFTGRVSIDVLNSHTRQSEQTRFRNLIEYGKSTTLLNLLGGDFDNRLNNVKLLPCPASPSHLPKLHIKNKNPHIKLTKDFLQFNNGLSISAGTEITIELENMQFRLKYL